MKKQQIVITSLLLIGAAALYKAKQKADQVLTIAGKLSFKLHKINTWHLDGNIITLNIDLKLINNTNLDFSANTGGFINFKKVELYTDTGVKLGEAVKNISNISLPANGSTILQNLETTGNLKNAVPLLLSIIFNKPNSITTKTQINVLGQDFTV